VGVSVLVGVSVFAGVGVGTFFSVVPQADSRMDSNTRVYKSLFMNLILLRLIRKHHTSFVPNEGMCTLASKEILIFSRHRQAVFLRIICRRVDETRARLA
jgi:hypothetical protein